MLGQQAADRLDAEHALVLVNEADERGRWPVQLSRELGHDRPDLCILRLVLAAMLGNQPAARLRSMKIILPTKEVSAEAGPVHFTLPAPPGSASRNAGSSNSPTACWRRCNRSVTKLQADVRNLVNGWTPRALPLAGRAGGCAATCITSASLRIFLSWDLCGGVPRNLRPGEDEIRDGARD